MGLVSGIVVYIVLWWLVLFITLPWGVHVPEKTEPGFATSAPEKPRLWLKAGVTTVVAAALWGITYLIIEAELFSFRDL